MGTSRSLNEKKLVLLLYNSINHQVNSSNDPKENFERVLDVLGCTKEELKKISGIYMSTEGSLKIRAKYRNFKFPVEYSKVTTFSSINPKILSNDDVLKSFIQEHTGDKVRHIRKIYQMENCKWVDYSMFRTAPSNVVRIIYSVENTLVIKAINLRDALEHLKDEYVQEFDKLESMRIKDSEYLATFSCSKKLWKLGVMEEFILKNYPDVIED